MFKKLNIILLVTVMSVNVSTYAKDWGRIGQVYPIKEMDLLDLIQARLKEMQKTGELEKLQKEAIARIEAHADRPTPVSNISQTIKYRKWFIDPSIVIREDVTDIHGNIIAKAGTLINPLNHAVLRSTFLFYDGDSKTQVAWVRGQNALLKGNAKLILVKGSIKDQFKIFKQKIMFDQHGRLVGRFKIRHTPAIAVQEGIRIRVEEVVP